MPETTLIVVQRLTGPPPAIVGGKKGDNDRPRVAVGLPRRGGEVWTNGRESFPRDVSHNIICNTGCRTPAYHPSPPLSGPPRTSHHNTRATGRPCSSGTPSPHSLKEQYLLTLLITHCNVALQINNCSGWKLFMILPCMCVRVYHQPCNATFTEYVWRREAWPMPQGHSLPSFPAWPPTPCQ